DYLERHALLAPNSEYVENQSVWQTLQPVCVYLHSQSAPLPPPEVWDALLSALAEPLELRNIGPKGDGPFQHFDKVNVERGSGMSCMTCACEMRRIRPHDG